MVIFKELNFKQFLIEMETTPAQKDNLRTIIAKLIANDSNWFDVNGIVAKNTGKYWILNYIQGGPHNTFNTLTRGLVVQKPNSSFQGDTLNLIKSFPFTRFYNRQEVDRAANVDFGNAEMIEKLDGTMVGVFFPDQDQSDPHWHTRKMLSSHEDDMKLTLTTFNGEEHNFLPLIGSYVKKVQFSKDDVDYTYVFEFIHSASAVWTKYTPEQYGLYLLGARNLKTHRELTESQLDLKAKSLNLRRPRRWNSTTDDEQIKKFMADMAKEVSGFEGYVFRDKSTGERVKLKDEDYVKMHHLVGKQSYRNLIVAYFNGEMDEVVAYFPHVKDMFKNIEYKYKNFIKKTARDALNYTDLKLSAKDLAVKVSKIDDCFLRSLIYKNIGKTFGAIKHYIETELKRTVLGTGTNNGSPRKVLELIGIEDNDEE